MKPQNIKYLFILILIISFGCKEIESLDGHYSNCYDGEYSEIYFKKDSMRVAADNKWVQLSEWRKIKIIKDTLFFESFGEWKNQEKAKIKYIGRNKIELSFLKYYDDEEFNLNQSFERIENPLNFNSTEDFWAKFRERENSAECATQTEKNAG